MSNENLSNKEAIDKLKDLVNRIDIAMMISFPKNSHYPYMTPMSRQEVDDDGDIWYLISSESETSKNLQSNNKISLAFGDPGSYTFLSIDGIAELSQDKSKIDKYWSKFMEVYFEKGKEDPSIRVLRVTPVESHYWDSKTNKFMTLIKVASAAISGQKIDIGREGELNI
ncbi:pyridoxamine 5'-phosphate oxidase family protein [Sphingobacterium bovistauri]|uniref:Pyridoxamine 5'-phosphate oxidase family protein n=1 Tax=Sphingobacterium bovistauri TaxID=2781959 RepID=A0ABS7Z793_9SPHI|nr:pyridoxamine 5'-phosphate oxidase family protein [Sphingobacterium bovistauri]MCA5004824.1 pyridoxamine 5'-phosphate oxidase family protein [Sphingobacterium bovistauri]